MSDLILRPNLETIQACYKKQGHVYIPGTYPAEVAASMGPELDDLFALVKPRSEILGEQKRTLVDPRVSRKNHPHITTALGAVGAFASGVLNCDIWPSPDGMCAQLDVIDMAPKYTDVVYGVKHRDKEELNGVVAITTYEGRSELWVEDDTVYELVPGGVVFLNNDRRLEHQGRAYEPRRALVIGNLIPKRRKTK